MLDDKTKLFKEKRNNVITTKKIHVLFFKKFISEK